MATKLHKRNLFKELEQGIREASAHNKGKLTLRTYVFEKQARPKVTAQLIRETRERLPMSRNVFALQLFVSP